MIAWGPGKARPGRPSQALKPICIFLATSSQKDDVLKKGFTLPKVTLFRGPSPPLLDSLNPYNDSIPKWKEYIHLLLDIVLPWVLGRAATCYKLDNGIHMKWPE